LAGVAIEVLTLSCAAGFLGEGFDAGVGTEGFVMG
jgi:hypothetical protein